MFGKGALIVAAGFSAVLGGYSLKMNRLAVGTSDNFYEVYHRNYVHEAAVSGMNYGINRVWRGYDDAETFSIFSDVCTTDVQIAPQGEDSVIVRSIARSYKFNDQKWLNDGELSLLQDTVIAFFNYNTPVSQWFYFTNDDMGIYWTTGDTVWGAMHCNKYVKTSGSPVFFGKITARLGINPLPGSRYSQAKYYGGWEVGIDAALPTDLQRIRELAITANDSAARNTRCVYDTLLTLKFLSNGNVVRTVGIRVSDTVSVNAIAPTGILYSSHDIRLSGTLNGQLTILSDDDIWLDDDLIYAQDPLTNPNADDFIGLVALDDIIVTDNAANNSNCIVNASILAVNGSFGAQNYSTRPIAGYLRIVGSLAQNTRGAVGTFSSYSGAINHGFSKRYYYDPRLKAVAPPNFPYVRSLRLSAWWE